MLASLDAPDGFAVFNPPAAGSYWLTEVTPPTGLTIAPPQLVHYTIPSTSMNCTILNGAETCQPDDDNSGGFVVVMVVHSPVSGVAPETATAAPIEDAPTAFPWLLVGGVFAGWLVLFTRLLRRRRG